MFHDCMAAVISGCKVCYWRPQSSVCMERKQRAQLCFAAIPSMPASRYVGLFLTLPPPLPNTHTLCSCFIQSPPHHTHLRPPCCCDLQGGECAVCLPANLPTLRGATLAYCEGDNMNGVPEGGTCHTFCSGGFVDGLDGPPIVRCESSVGGTPQWSVVTGNCTRTGWYVRWPPGSSTA